MELLLLVILFCISPYAALGVLGLALTIGLVCSALDWLQYH
jgi:hypothetical protein